ncbi:unnamed protein product [Gongylonema pulchrum]|uniref:Reverse transcriptase domain-containing protein n=1 Tax=Gongylonema pulchrum TaxID=637853 RepID=A0A183E4M4_9BILA|nr:unnamed protein product [Gongylonema pulchrum]
MVMRQLQRTELCLKEVKHFEVDVSTDFNSLYKPEAFGHPTRTLNRSADENEIHVGENIGAAIPSKGVDFVVKQDEEIREIGNILEIARQLTKSFSPISPTGSTGKKLASKEPDDLALKFVKSTSSLTLERKIGEVLK